MSRQGTSHQGTSQMGFFVPGELKATKSTERDQYDHSLAKGSRGGPWRPARERRKRSNKGSKKRSRYSAVDELADAYLERHEAAAGGRVSPHREYGAKASSRTLSHNTHTTRSMNHIPTSSTSTLPYVNGVEANAVRSGGGGGGAVHDLSRSPIRSRSFEHRKKPAHSKKTTASVGVGGDVYSVGRYASYSYEDGGRGKHSHQQKKKPKKKAGRSKFKHSSKSDFNRIYGVSADFPVPHEIVKRSSRLARGSQNKIASSSTNGMPEEYAGRMPNLRSNLRAKAQDMNIESAGYISVATQEDERLAQQEIESDQRERQMWKEEAEMQHRELEEAELAATRRQRRRQEEEEDERRRQRANEEREMQRKKEDENRQRRKFEQQQNLARKREMRRQQEEEQSLRRREEEERQARRRREQQQQQQGRHHQLQKKKTPKKSKGNQKPALKEDKIDEQLEFALAELHDIKKHYEKQRSTGQNAIKAERAKTVVTSPSRSQDESPAALRERLKLAENVMTKLYQRNIQLEKELKVLRTSGVTSDEGGNGINVETRAVSGTQSVAESNSLSLPASSSSAAANTSQLLKRVAEMRDTVDARESTIGQLRDVIEGLQNRYALTLQREVEGRLNVELAAMREQQAVLAEQLANAKADASRREESEKRARHDYNRLANRRIKEFSLDPHVDVASKQLLTALGDRLNQEAADRAAESATYNDRLYAAERKQCDFFVERKLLEQQMMTLTRELEERGKLEERINSCIEGIRSQLEALRAENAALKGVSGGGEEDGSGGD